MSNLAADLGDPMEPQEVFNLVRRFNESGMELALDFREFLTMWQTS